MIFLNICARTLVYFVFSFFRYSFPYQRSGFHFLNYVFNESMCPMRRVRVNEIHGCSEAWKVVSALFRGCKAAIGITEEILNKYSGSWRKTGKLCIYEFMPTLKTRFWFHYLQTSVCKHCQLIHTAWIKVPD